LSPLDRQRRGPGFGRPQVHEGHTAGAPQVHACPFLSVTFRMPDSCAKAGATVGDCDQPD